MSKEIQSQITNVNGALYDKNGHIVGHVPFDEVQVDTLTFQPLADKVMQILIGDPTFHAEDINMEYDEAEGEWETDVNDELEVDPIDEYTDKSDVFDMKNDINEKMETVKQSIVEEGKNKPSEAPESSLENSPEEKQE